LALPKIASHARVDHILFLNRHPGAKAHLRPYPKEEALREIDSSFCFGRTSSIEAQKAAARRLLELDVFELVYSDTGSAVECIRSLTA
jgi:hypothetical protein